MRKFKLNNKNLFYYKKSNYKNKQMKNKTPFD